MPTRLDNYSTATPYQWNRDAIFQCMHPDCREPVEDEETLCDYCAESATEENEVTIFDRYMSQIMMGDFLK